MSGIPKATLDALAIRGIRSFDPQKMERINFAKPGVTVIVGHNGSGKTTIVECLKYATTGEQPPNTRGGAFVHDPKMAHEKEVKAQVKLRFYARDGVRTTATRNLQVTAKKTGLTMKTLEALLEREDPGDGKRKRISTKCAEIDAEVPHLLGVSKSVLENVIFCHQEDSYWPLAEPSVLKKKFDDIFEATKYTKALDNIKGIRKERAADLKAEKVLLESLAQQRSQAEKLSQQIANYTSEVDEKEARIKELEGEEMLITKDNMEFYDQAKKFSEIYLKADEWEAQKKTYIEEARKAESALGDSNLSPEQASDEVLQAEIDSFETTNKEREREVNRLQKLLKEEIGEGEALRTKLRNVEKMQGRLKGDAQRHQEDLNSRKTVVQKLSASHAINFSHTNGSEEDAVDEFIRRIKALKRQKDAEAEKVQSSIVAAKGEYSQKLAELRSESRSHAQDRDRSQAEISKLQSSIAQAETVVDQVKEVETLIKFNNDDLKDRRRRLDNLTQEIADARFDDHINQKTKAIHQAEGEREALYSERGQASLQANERSKLDLKKADLKKKQAFVDRILETHTAKFQTYLQIEPQPDTMETDIETLITVKTREAARLEAEYNKRNRESAESHAAHERLIDDLEGKRATVERLEKLVHDAANINNLPTMAKVTLDQALKDAALELRDLQERTGSIEGTHEFYKNLLEDGRKTKKCSVCDRKLVSTKEMETYEQILLDKIAQTTREKIADNKFQISEWTKELERLQKYLPMQAEARKAKIDIPELERTLAELARKDEASATETEKAGNALKEMRATLADLSALREQARTVTRTNEEIRATRIEITQLERSLQSSGTTRTDSELQSEIDEVSQKIRNLERERQLLQSQKDRQRQSQNNFGTEIHSLEMKGRDLEARLLEGRNTEAKIQQEKALVSDLRAKIPTLLSRISSIESEVDSLLAEQKELELRLSSQLSVAQEQSSALDSDVRELDNIQGRIEKYRAEDGERRLAECTQQVAELETQVSNIHNAVEHRRIELTAAEKEVNQGRARLSIPNDILKLRRLLAHIKQLQEKIDNLPVAQAAESKRTFDTQWDAMVRRERHVKDRIATLRGEIGTRNATIKDLKKNLSTDFKNIAKRYMDQLIKVKMSDMANNDLEKYAKALDNAIMKYHTLKMEEVNDIMRHLWNKTYQGTDIDGIMIRSEGDGGSTGRRSYNYRVVMMKDQVEMDMRGRCSAGQKMLASIIIRLALSDSFAQDCGILALDEPTNALDIENIEALAASLVEIINERKRAANFQLIIITHDENFLRKLGENGVIQDYWRVTRSDNQKSIIEKHRLV